MIDRNFKTKKYQGTNDIQVVRAHVGLLVVIELVATTSRYGHGDVVWLPRHGVVVVLVVVVASIVVSSNDK